MLIFASEDVGNADPHALSLAVAVQQAVHFVGMPEGWIPLAQAATYLACAPKSNASYLAMTSAREAVKETGPLPVPFHLRNAPTGLMKALGYGKGYQYPHDHPGHHVAETYLPEALKGKAFYKPTEEGAEKGIRERQARRNKKS
jgi:putative ATPase